MAYNGAEPEEEETDPETGEPLPPKERFREVHRLSFVVEVRNVSILCLL
jgi:hypothetical protein